MINKLKYYRRLKGYSQEKLAYICSVSRNTISSIECNQYRPGILLASRINYVLNCKCFELDDSEIDELHLRWKIIHHTNADPPF